MRDNRNAAFTLLELMVVVAIVVTLAMITTAGARKVLHSSSLAGSVNNLRQLAAGAAAYLSDNNYTYWPYRASRMETGNRGVVWWFGFEPQSSLSLPEGRRILDTKQGPLAGYVPGGFRPDPSFSWSGKPFKPKYQFGYIGVGYNILLGGGWMGLQPRLRYWDLPNPAEVVVFSTSAQVNTFQRPATPGNPMIEEFYGIDDRETTVHFRHHGKAIVAFANGSAGFLEMDESTRDMRAPGADVGRFAPRGDPRFLR